MASIAIRAAGMVTGIGLSAPSSCAAMRCGINNFQETRFMDRGGEWILGSEVPLEEPWRGIEKLAKLGARALSECLAGLDESPESIPLFLCTAEKDRPGRLNGLDDIMLGRIQAELGIRFHSRSSIFPEGRVSGALALQEAAILLQKNEVRYCLVAGADSYLVAPTLASFEEQERLLTSKNSNGFIPGEAGAAVLVARANSAEYQLPLLFHGIGFGHEKANVTSEEPLRANGLVEAIKAALTSSGLTWKDLDYRITDLNGEQYAFKEAALALARLMRVRKPEFDIWHPADCIGEVGAAVVPIILGVALAASRKKYAPGPGILCHVSNDDGKRAALILSNMQKESS